MAPTLSREEKFILRASERKDVFSEKFIPQDDVTLMGSSSKTEVNSIHPRSANDHDLSTRTRADSLSSLQSSRSKPESNSSSGSSVVWIGSNNVSQDSHSHSHSHSHRPRSSFDEVSRQNGHSSTSADSHSHLPKMTLDTHFYDTTITYKKTKLNIRVPLSTFPEEVGDVRTYSTLSYFMTCFFSIVSKKGIFYSIP